MIIEILGGIAAKLAGLGAAAKATVGVGVAAAAVTTAGVTGLVPLPDLPIGADTPPAVEVELPDVPTAEADFGLRTANDAVSGQLSVGVGEGEEEDAPGGTDGGRPDFAGQPDVKGVDRAAQTPAAEHLPSFVPGPPAGVPGGQPSGDPGSVGIDIARQTPAANYLPPFVPGPPAGVSGGESTGEQGAGASGSAAAGGSGAGSVGTDIAKQTPAAGRIPR